MPRHGASLVECRGAGWARNRIAISLELIMSNQDGMVLMSDADLEGIEGGIPLGLGLFIGMATYALIAGVLDGLEHPNPECSCAQ